MAKLWLPCLLLLLPAHNISFSQTTVKVNRCCHHSQTLNKARDRCVTALHPQVPMTAPSRDSFGTVPGLSLSSASSGKVEIKADVEKVAMPDCGRTETHLLGSEAWLTEQGGIVTNQYEKEFPHGNFCLETDIDQDLVVIMCDPCQEKICLKICCPHGQIFKPNYEAEPGPDDSFDDNCKDNSQQWSPLFWNHQDEEEVKLEKHSEYVLKSDRKDGGSFNCPKRNGKPGSRIPDNVNFGKFVVNDQGIAMGTFFDSNVTEKFNNTQFCVTYAHLLDYDEYYSDYGDSEGSGAQIPIERRVAFLVCHYEEDEKQGCVSGNFYSSAIIISCVFLLLTIVAHMILPQLHNNMIGKMTIGFLINMLICYICLAYTYIISNNGDYEDIIGTPGCAFLGYCIQYTFIAFFFWLNSMAAYIFFKTTRIIHFNIYHDAKQLILFFIYSQVFPFFISIATAIVDFSETDNERSRRENGNVKPNMGVFNCFMSSQKRDPPLPFFKTPEFVYFHSIILFIIILNVIYFTVTLVLIGLAHMSSRSAREGGIMANKHNIRLVLTLFFLMGIPWVSELIGGLAKEAISCEVMIFLDVLNLFAGPLIFLVLVVKKEILVSLKNVLISQQVEGTTTVRSHISMTPLS